MEQAAVAGERRSAGSHIVRWAKPDDEAAIRRLLRESPIPGAVSLAFEREPDAWQAAEIEGDRHHTVLFQPDPAGPVMGMGTRTVQRVYVNGEPAWLGYLSQLRIDRRYQGRCIRVLKAGFQALAASHQADECAFDWVSLVAGNDRASRLLMAGVPGLPAVHPWQPFTTLVLPTGGRSARLRGVAIEPLSRPRLGEWVAFLNRHNRNSQFAPVWEEGDFLPGGRCRDIRWSDVYLAVHRDAIVGGLARWDQRRVKQYRVVGYAPDLARWRAGINALAPWMRWPPLPALGECLNQGFISHIAVDDPSIFPVLLQTCLAESRSYDILTLGLSEADPLLSVVRRSLPGRAYDSTLCLVDWTGEGNPAQALDGRPVHVEVALL